MKTPGPFPAALLLVVLAGCASGGTGVGMNPPPPLKVATIELYRDADERCHTSTTPYVKVKKGRERVARWDIRDKVGCTEQYGDVEVKFDKPNNADPLAGCSKRGRRRIECSLTTAETGRREYSVWIDGNQEDPVLEIEQP
jgi:hypothetical protein